jgi:hypothetical protein
MLNKECDASYARVKEAVQLDGNLRVFLIYTLV